MPREITLHCFQEMLKLQESMNQVVHPEWRTQQFLWYRAIWTECAEMLDHLGWKWWKKQTPDWPQVHLELIDIWHFGLSDLLELNSDPQTLCMELAEAYEAACEKTAPTEAPEALRQSIETFAQACLTTHRFSLSLFYPMLIQANLTLEDLYRHYVGKNVLNRFRQDKGYKQGIYLKEWQGREDNEHLAEILISVDIQKPQLIQEIYDQLAERYAQLTQEA